MKSTNRMNRWKGVPRMAAAGVVSAALLATAVSPALAAGPAAVVPAAPAAVAAPSYTQQVLASNDDNGIDPILGKYYRIVALADLGSGVLLASYDGVRPVR
jgi:sialidase-1